MRGHLVVALPGVEIVDPSSVSLLGSPLGDIVSIDRAVKEKLEALKIMGSRFQHISAHDALTLLRHSFSIPKLRYLLRTAPCFLSSLLEEYDHTLRTILSSVTNTPLLHNDRAWLQAVLPVKSGGLGVRRAADLALPLISPPPILLPIWCLQFSANILHLNHFPLHPFQILQ